MISALISILVALVVLGLVWYLVKMLPIPEPLRRIVDVIFVIIAILLVLAVFTGGVTMPFRL